LASVEITGCASEKSNRQILYIAPTIGEARDILWLPLKKLTQPNWSKEPNDTRLEIELKAQNGGTSTIFLKGWEAIEAIRGMEFDLIVTDEVAKYKSFWSLWNEVVRPTLTPRKGKGLFLSTPRGFNAFYDLCNLELTDSDYKTFHFTTYDNPHIPVEEIEKAKKELSQEQFLQEYMASFQKTSGLVYKEFSRSKHLYDELPRGTFSKIAGIDFGYTHPAVVLDIRTNGELYFIEDEWVKTGRTENQIAEYVAANSFEAVYPDPESPSAIEELRRKNINVREVIKGKDSVKSGIQKVRELLINGRLKVNRKCVNMIAGFEMYSYDGDNPKENPIKENDDCADAIRYVLMMADFKPELNKEIRQHLDRTEYRLKNQSSR